MTTPPEVEPADWRAVLRFLLGCRSPVSVAEIARVVGTTEAATIRAMEMLVRWNVVAYCGESTAE